MYWITNYSKGLILICFACVGLWKDQIQCSRSKDAFGISGRPLMTRILVNCWKTVRTVNRRRPSIVQETRLSSTRVWPSLRAMGFTSVYTGTYLAEWQILIQVSSWLCPSVHFPHCTIQIRATFTGILHPRHWVGKTPKFQPNVIGLTAITTTWVESQAEVFWSNDKFENVELKQGGVDDPRQRRHFTLHRLNLNGSVESVS